MTRSSPTAIGWVTAKRSDAAAGTEAPAAALPVAACGPADATRLIEVIADSFLRDPTWSWAFPDPALRVRWWSFCIESALRYPWVLKTGGFECVSVWIPPAGSEFSPEEERRIPELLKELAGQRVAEVEELLRRFEAAHPRDEPHYYLSLLGTQTGHRGRGLGMSLLRENLARVDAEGAPAYLESSNPANDPRYESVGFVKVAEFQAPADGPVVSGMWRKGK